MPAVLFLIHRYFPVNIDPILVGFLTLITYGVTVMDAGVNATPLTVPETVSV